jgi:hypothetical protein
MVFQAHGRHPPSEDDTEDAEHEHAGRLAPLYELNAECPRRPLYRLRPVKSSGRQGASVWAGLMALAKSPMGP